VGDTIILLVMYGIVIVPIVAILHGNETAIMLRGN